MSLLQRLAADAAAMGVPVSEHDAARLVTLLDELERWNRTFNLTAIRRREHMVTHHLLDSLSVHRDLQGVTVADVGTGAGFPGLPLAVVNPTRRFTLIDSNGKKIRFVSHAAHLLGLTNVEAVHARVEALQPAERFDTVVSRAFAALATMLEQVAPLCGTRTSVLAMKGRLSKEELDGVPAAWQVVASRQIKVPGLDEARCVVALRNERG